MTTVACVVAVEPSDSSFLLTVDVEAVLTEPVAPGTFRWTDDEGNERSVDVRRVAGHAGRRWTFEALGEVDVMPDGAIAGSYTSWWTPIRWS